MEIPFTIENLGGNTWKATCKDPELEVEGEGITSVCRAMATKLEKWFVDVFNTTRKVSVTLPIIKAKVKASVSVRTEKPLDEFHAKKTDATMEKQNQISMETGNMVASPKILTECTCCGMEVLAKVGNENPLCESCLYEQSVASSSATPKKVIDGPCRYLSDGKGLLPVGKCEAVSNDISETPGIRIDGDGACEGDYQNCTFYIAGGIRISDPEQPEDSYQSDEIDEYGAPGDAIN